MRPISKILVFASALALWAAMAAMSPAHLRAQQHSYTPAEIEEGRKLYDANCGRCHNDTGDGVTGVELFKQIRRATSDEGVVKIIREGLAGTSMPPHSSFSEMQAQNVVAYLRSMVGVAPAARGGAPAAAGGAGRGAAALAGGDAARGKALFDGKGGCLGCHQVGSSGGQVGPDLTLIGQPRPVRGLGPAGPDIAQIERSILDPNAEIGIPYRFFRVVTKGGAETRGKLLNQDTFSVQMLDSSQMLRSFIKTDLRESGFVPSPMPSYQGKLTPQEMADLLTYLVSLKG